MIEIKNKDGNRAIVYAETFDYTAYDQIKRLINFDAYKGEKIRVMPDAHAGIGCTVGTTMTISDKITPNLVGVDIGCGMSMFKISIHDNDINLSLLDEVINDCVPHGFSVHDESIRYFDFSNLRCVDHVGIGRAKLSLGSLGGGNHFIELARGENDGSVYLIIHSGSRKLGGDVCKYYQNLAIRNDDSILRKEIITRLKREGRSCDIEKELKNIKRPTIDKQLAYLIGQDFDDYMNDMRIVQGYAETNRETIADIIIKNLGLSYVDYVSTIHNYIDFNRMILRKGAVSANEGERLLIPINMRDGSLLCVGKGNSDWNYSAPHGAGRLMSRREAKEKLDLDEFESRMGDVYTTSVGRSTLDEAPGAYKSMEEILGCISDTVDVLDVLKPIYNFKSS